MPASPLSRALLTTLAASLSALGAASKIVEFQTLDEEHLMIRCQDAWVHHDEDTGPIEKRMHDSRPNDRIEVFGKPLDLTLAQGGYMSLSSKDDPSYRVPLAPVKVYRKTKVSGTAWKWPDPDLTYEHTLYLKLPRKLVQGRSYTLKLSPLLNLDKSEQAFTFDVFKNLSEALHVNMIGFDPGQTASKTADLYLWMGDGGARDYSSFVGRKSWLVNVKTGGKTPAGPVKFWAKSGPDYGKWNLTRSDVWTADFSSAAKPGRYRLAIEGVGASQEFDIKPDVYFEPFKTSVRGFYFMRIGEPNTIKPLPRQPRYIPGVDPPGFTIYMTTYSPWHPDWKKGQGDQWDVKDWSKSLEPGKPTNPKAIGGHSDAADWDRHLGHVSIIWDLLLPYLLSNGRGGEDNLGIRESGNGIPDIIDEAQNEVDFWLNLRDTKGGYATGLNNPSQEGKVMYQAAARPYQAWANAANAAMLADAFRIAKKPALMVKYRDAALEAWRIAGEQDLDEKHSVGNGVVRGRDNKVLAAACLYNVTGDRKYEDIIAKETVIKSPTSFTEENDVYNQTYGTAVYLMTSKHKWRPIGRPALVKMMKAAMIHQATERNVKPSESWPSRRSAETAWGWFQAIQDNQRLCVAHAVVEDPALKKRMLRALILEADWGLGRNPMNMVQMTGLGARRPDQIYTSGRNDGFPEVHPGHTPYMNSENWGSGFMADPQYYARKGYPEWSKWPQGEALWRAPYCYSNNEFTPQQSMRGKHCLYGYLYGLGRPASK